MQTLDNKILDIHPQSLLVDNSKTRVMTFDNKFDLLSFLKKQTPIKNSVEYTKTFMENLKEYKQDTELVDKIKKEVLNNLIKRGIVTGAVYEGYKYSINGDIIDYAALASGDPVCMMEPIKKYDKWFYELYINMSVPGSVDGDNIIKGAIRLIETIKALESRDIEIKINIIDYSSGVYNNEPISDLLVIIPLISHLEHKDYNNIMPFITDAFLRGPLFTIARNSIDNTENVDSGMGSALCLTNAVNLWKLKEDDEIDLAIRILDDLGIPHEV